MGVGTIVLQEIYHILMLILCSQNFIETFLWSSSGSSNSVLCECTRSSSSNLRNQLGTSQTTVISRLQEQLAVRTRQQHYQSTQEQLAIRARQQFYRSTHEQLAVRTRQ
jgi:hypothetical protein